MAGAAAAGGSRRIRLRVCTDRVWASGERYEAKGAGGRGGGGRRPESHWVQQRTNESWVKANGGRVVRGRREWVSDSAEVPLARPGGLGGSAVAGAGVTGQGNESWVRRAAERIERSARAVAPAPPVPVQAAAAGKAAGAGHVAEERAAAGGRRERGAGRPKPAQEQQARLASLVGMRGEIGRELGRSVTGARGPWTSDRGAGKSWRQADSGEAGDRRSELQGAGEGPSVGMAALVLVAAVGAGATGVVRTGRRCRSSRTKTQAQRDD